VNRVAAARLGVAAAVPLAHALVQHLAAVRGIRVLSIKGPVASLHGLRLPRASADADLLIDPERTGELFAALREAGWHSRPAVTVAPRVLPQHSVTYVHDDWPCDLDLHHYFPGFLAGDAVAFEALWAERSTGRIANRPAVVAGRGGSILISLLHALRAQDARSLREIDQTLAVVRALDPAEVRRLVQLAHATGAIEPLREVLQSAGCPLPAPVPGPVDPALLLWRLRVVDGTRTTAWLMRLRAARWWQRPGVLWAALFPPRAQIRAERPGMSQGRAALVGAILVRLGRGLRQLPVSVRNLWRSRI
jgi:hypothetical protein